MRKVGSIFTSKKPILLYETAAAARRALDRWNPEIASTYDERSTDADVVYVCGTIKCQCWPVPNDSVFVLLEKEGNLIVRGTHEGRLLKVLVDNKIGWVIEPIFSLSSFFAGVV